MKYNVVKELIYVQRKTIKNCDFDVIRTKSCVIPCCSSWGHLRNMRGIPLHILYDVILKSNHFLYEIQYRYRHSCAHMYILFLRMAIRYRVRQLILRFRKSPKWQPTLENSGEVGGNKGVGKTDLSNAPQVCRHIFPFLLKRNQLD
jgi:hypothetical protein